jgi:hypothetical protein
MTLRIAPRYNSIESLSEKIGEKHGLAAELLYLPFYLFGYTIVAERARNKKTSEKGLLLVDLINGIPINVMNSSKISLANGGEKIKDLIGDKLTEERGDKVIRIDEAEISKEKLPPPRLPAEEAKRKALWVLRWDLMRVLGGFRYKEVNILSNEKGAIIYYPYWISIRF